MYGLLINDNAFSGKVLRLRFLKRLPHVLNVILAFLRQDEIRLVRDPSAQRAALIQLRAEALRQPRHAFQAGMKRRSRSQA